MGELLAIHELVETAEVDSSTITEREITSEMQNAFLSDNGTAKMTYHVEADDSKTIFTITLWNLNGRKMIIELNGTHDTLGTINDYILQRAQQPNAEIILPTDTVNTNIGPGFQDELDEIIRAIAH